VLVLCKPSPLGGAARWRFRLGPTIDCPETSCLLILSKDDLVIDLNEWDWGTYANTNNTWYRFVGTGSYTQWLYKRMIVSSLMIRHMIKQTDHKPQWHLLIDNNLNILTLGSYWLWRCGILKFTICFVWQHISRTPELSNDTSFNSGVQLAMEMWHFQFQNLFCLVVLSWHHYLNLENFQSPLNWWLALPT
jgi:hypothetical protein